jgi:hypothetical protein
MPEAAGEAWPNLQRADESTPFTDRPQRLMRLLRSNVRGLALPRTSSGVMPDHGERLKEKVTVQTRIFRKSVTRGRNKVFHKLSRWAH